MSTSTGTRVPKGLDDQPRFLLLPFDIVVVFMVTLFAGALLEQIKLGTAAAFLAAYGWHRAVARCGRSFGIALIYWHLGLVSLNHVMPSAKRRFIG